jgi:hypothetical protein
LKPVIQYGQRGPRRAVGGIALVLGAGIAWGAFELGQQRAGHNRFEANAREVELRAALQEAELDRTRLQEQVALLETDARIKAAAYSQVETQLAGLQAQIQKQSEDIAFYRGIVGDQTGGLRVQDFGLFPGAAPGDFSVRVVLAQALRDGRRVSGTVELTIAGERDGEREVMDLGELVVDGPDRLQFSFRYFQNLEASLRLPNGFAPQSVTVRVRPKGKGVEPVEASFDWELRQG